MGGWEKGTLSFLRPHGYYRAARLEVICIVVHSLTCFVYIPNPPEVPEVTPQYSLYTGAGRADLK